MAILSILSRSNARLSKLTAIALFLSASVLAAHHEDHNSSESQLTAGGCHDDGSTYDDAANDRNSSSDLTHGNRSGTKEKQNAISFEPVVITAPIMQTPLSVSFDPKSPQQPLPANDGAALLKAVAGMSVTRKGGIDGDPSFRGMGASRLNISLDGEQILGGCGGRMDPPTAYVFPDSYDRVTILKGPQSVIHGAGSSAGSVLFERDRGYYAEPTRKANLSATIASFDRYEEFAAIEGGFEYGYAKTAFTNAKSSDYKDGDGEKVHSRYQRASSSAAFGWTPNKDTLIEISGAQSDGEAAYADRGMDGSRFARENYGIKFEKSAISDVLYEIKAQAYHNYIDHVMDNYSLRTSSGMAMASNPDRKTRGGRLELTFTPTSSIALIAGGDLQTNKHTGRSGSNTGPNYYGDKERVEDARFQDYGVFGELTFQANRENTLIVGARSDSWKSTDKRQSISVGSGMSAATVANPTADKTRDENLISGFIRYERGFLDNGAFYIGVGRSERAPDFWEAINKESENSVSVFDSIETEKTTQLDVGLTWNSEDLQSFASLFYGKIEDYILIQSQYEKPAGMMTTRSATIARNVDATTYGGEAGVSYRFAPNWKSAVSIAYTRSQNDDDDRPLGQTPPLESRLNLDWDDGEWSIGALWRLVASQNRYSLNEGNIVGQDLDKAGGFGVFSINGAYRWNKSVQIAFGVDNLFDKTYAEFISKGGVMVSGYEQTDRVNEPGRTLWVKAQIALD
ncbi:MAG: TonB-dependent copper receptor [Helicobacteraceae bacterium]|jgi:iron complex outermembrane receptor protein|nr:TonB-dependent copper receptor [Helicobacteraceae bacterium]